MMRRYVPLQQGLENDENVKVRHAPGVIDYYVGGAADEVTLRENIAAWLRYRIRPRYLTQNTAPSISCKILDRWFESPIAVAPVALQKMISSDSQGEISMARACHATNTLMIVSTISTTSIEDITHDISQIGDASNLWFQLYLYNDRDLTASLVKRAARAGMGAIVVTVDLPRLAIRERDLRNDFKVSERFEVSNFTIPELRYQRRRPYNDRTIQKYGRDSQFNWDDLAWLRSLTNLPVFLKGVLSAEDAVKAARSGCAGIIVSNHGGRQLDCVQATCDALPAIIDALKPWPQFLVAVDGGIRSGASVFKALSLGANFVLIGRAAIHGLSTLGQQGVSDVLYQLRDELSNVMLQTGTCTLKEVRSDSIVHQDVLHSRL